jgi:hypothetical protein
MKMDQRDRRRVGWSWWYLLFLAQFVAVLWPPFYNRVDPTLIGIPFFYWYQLLWIIIGAILTATVYFVTEDGAPRETAGGERTTGRHPQE